MSFIGNILWIILGGFLLFLMYFFGGLLLCCTIIGIPFAKAHFRLMKMSFMPFGTNTVA